MFHLAKHGWNFIHTDPNFCVQRDNDINEYILLIIRSPFFMSLNNNPVQIYDKNCIVLIEPNTPHYYGVRDNQPFINDWAWFTTNENTVLQTNTVYEGFNDYDINLLSHSLNDIISERREDKLNASEIISTLFRYILLKIDQLSSVKHTHLSDNPHYAEMLYARNLILSNFQNDISIDSFAEELHLSPSFFRHLYKEIFNISPQADLINTRIQYAQYLLKTTNDPINKIAEDCGYLNPEHFMRQFKKKVGATPSQYR